MSISQISSVDIYIEFIWGMIQQQFYVDAHLLARRTNQGMRSDIRRLSNKKEIPFSKKR